MLTKIHQTVFQYSWILLFSAAIIIWCTSCKNSKQSQNEYISLASQKQDRGKRYRYLQHLRNTYNSDKDGKPQEVPIWENWLVRSGELPPDFNRLPANAFPPDLLRFQDGNPVTNPKQWSARKQEIRRILDKYMFGQWPPPPHRISIHRSYESEDFNQYRIEYYNIYFSLSPKAVNYADQFGGGKENFINALLSIKVYVPEGEGPFPAIINMGPVDMNVKSAYERGRDLFTVETPIVYECFTIEALKRGYMVCQFSRKDANMIPAVYVNYECNQLEWWAYAACRCVDFLYTRDDVDTSKIVVAGHSRNGKTAMLAALMDERIDALINSHSGTGAGGNTNWRYGGEKYGGETLENITRRFPYWNHPRLRFFAGRENKLPFDSHFLPALFAPKPSLIGIGEFDPVGEPWGDQQVYLAVKEVYKLLGNEEKLGFYAYPGGHTRTLDMMASYLDWLDLQFGRNKPNHFKDRLIYTYSFHEWQRVTGETINIYDFPEKVDEDILSMNGKMIRNEEEWKTKVDDIRGQIEWMIGDLPHNTAVFSSKLINERAFGNNLAKAELHIDDKLKLHLTYPAGEKRKIPVVIYLHAYLDALGHNWPRNYGYETSVGERLAQYGFLAVEFDQFGYGQRNRDSGIEFYADNPKISALGVMISDVSKIIDAMNQLDWVDKDNILVAGYSLGGMVGLYAAVFDERIKAVATACGMGSMRLDVHGNQTEGIQRYSYLRPTIPRLGLFLGNESRIPYDFHEVIALIAPRPVFILAPILDQDWFHEDVLACYREAEKVYNLYNKKNNLLFRDPNDFNRYPPEYQEMVNEWLVSNIE